MTFEIEVYSRDDPRVRVDHLPNAIKPKFIEEREGVGGGSLSVHGNDPRSTDPTVLQDRNIVKCKVDGKFRSAFIIQSDSPTYVGKGEESDELRVISGSGLKDWLRDAELSTEFGIAGTTYKSRSFNFSSNAVMTGTTKTWYDETVWTRPKHIAKYGQFPFLYVPANWPDAPDSYWMWSEVGTPEPTWGRQQRIGFNYFRTEFKVTSADFGKYSLFVAADDILEAYVDGQLVSSNTPGVQNWEQVQRIDFDIDIAGTHVVAIKVQNIHYRAGLIATLFKNGDAAKKEKSRIVRASKSGDWWVAGYPETPPNWTVGEIWNQLLKEAKSRGVRFANFVTPGYTEFKDSNGVPWSRELEWTFSIGESYLSIANKMGELGIDVWIDPADYTLKIAQNRGRDRTTAAQGDVTPVLLRVGHDLQAAGQKSEWDVKNSLTVNTNGKRIVVQDKDSIAKYGVVEGTMDLEADSVLSRLIASKIVTTKSAVTQGATYTVVPRADSVPFVDYQVGDWIMAPGSDGPRTRRRVESITMAVDGDAGHVSYSVEFDSVFPSRQLRLEKWVTNTLNGTIAGRAPVSGKLSDSGTGLTVGNNNVGMTVPPVPPVITDVATTSYYAPSGVPQASARLSWEPVVATEEGLEADIVAYEVWSTNTTTSTSEAEAAQVFVARTASTDVIVDQLQPSSTYQFQVKAVNSRGVTSDYSSYVTIDTKDSTDLDDVSLLPVPSSPIIQTRAGSVTVTFDGQMTDNQTPDQSSSAVRVMLSKLSGGPYEVVGPSIPLTGGSVTLTELEVDTQYFIALVTQSNFGKLSATSTEAPVVVASITWDDLDSTISDDLAVSSRVPKVPENLAVAANVPGWGTSAEAVLTLTWDEVVYGIDDEPVECSYELFDHDVPVWTGSTTSATVRVLAGSSHSYRLRAISTGGVPGDPTDPVVVVGVTPPVASIAPSAPTLTTALGMLVATWDGTYAGGASDPSTMSVAVEARVAGGTWVQQGAAMSKAGDQSIGLGSVGDTVEVRLVSLDRLSRVTGTSVVVSKEVVGVEHGDMDLSPAWFDAVFANEAMFGRIKANQLEPSVGGQLNLTANESIVLMAGRQDELGSDLAAAIEHLDEVADTAQEALTVSEDASYAAALADGKALVAQAQAQDASDRLSQQQAVFRVTAEGADISSVDGSNSVQITPNGVSIVQGGTAASTWDAGRLIVSEAIVSKATLGNHVVEKSGSRSIWRPL